MDIDQDVARRLLVEGATLLVLDVPEGTNFGIDMKSWETGERFKGVKMIPPGMHFVYHSAVGRHGDTGPRTGFMHYFKRGDIVLKKWDSNSGEIDHSKTVTEEELQRIRANLFEIDRFLGPYPYEIWDKWKLLSDRITEPLATKLMPESGVIRSALELVSHKESSAQATEVESSNDATNTDGSDNSANTANAESSSSEANSPNGKHTCPTSGDVGSYKRRRHGRPLTVEEIEEDLLPELKPAPGTALRLTHFPKLYYPPGSTPAEITYHSMDSSYALNTLLDQHERSDDLVGEMQFSFLCFLVGQSLEAFEHWKKLVTLICNCEKAIMEKHDLYEKLMWALEPQLWEVQEDFLADIVTNNNAIYGALRKLFRCIQSPENNMEPRFKTRAARFAERLTEKFSWDFSDIDEEEDDEKPVIVDL